jgi:predicted dinucleotide-utilizing enzyme
VQLVADPELTTNVGTVTASSRSSTLGLTMTSEASPSDPKTSAITALG